MEQSQLRKLQLIGLDILKEFIKICTEHKLKYYVVGGTALGAVRHNGFIPWDDDIDVAMPRRDYDKFINITSKNIKYPYEVQTVDNGEDNVYPFVRIADKRVELLLTQKKVERKVNLCMDVFPLDGLPNSKIARYFHMYMFEFKKCLYQISVFKEVVHQHRKNRPIHKRIIIWFCNKFEIQKFFNKKKRFLAADKLLKIYSFYETIYCCGSLWGAYGFEKETLMTEWFGDGVCLRFEDIEVVAPTHYKEYLQHVYGDYTVPPPIEIRTGHGIKALCIKE